MVENTAPTRQQLERIAQGDYRLLTALERLFEQSEESGDFDDIAALFAQSSQASFTNDARKTADEAAMLANFASVSRIAKEALLIAMRAEAKAAQMSATKADDFSPFFRAPIASGANGTFTAGSGEVITVENGVIKSIV